MNGMPTYVEYELYYRQNELLREAEAERLAAQLPQTPVDVTSRSNPLLAIIRRLSLVAAQFRTALQPTGLKRTAR
jgi:hypothetical protein